MTAIEDNTHAPPLTQMILSDGTPKRAFLTALVVGTILTVINHGDDILIGVWPSKVKVMLTYLVPYCVTTWGAVTGKRAQWRRAQMTRAPVQERR